MLEAVGEGVLGHLSSSDGEGHLLQLLRGRKAFIRYPIQGEENQRGEGGGSLIAVYEAVILVKVKEVGGGHCRQAVVEIRAFAAR